MKLFYDTIRQTKVEADIKKNIKKRDERFCPNIFFKRNCILIHFERGLLPEEEQLKEINMFLSEYGEVASQDGRSVGDNRVHIIIALQEE